MVELQEIFDIKNGLASSNVKVFDESFEGAIPYIRPASTFKRTVAGYVSPLKIDSKHIYPADSLFVSTDGEGSHSYRLYFNHCICSK